LILNSNNGIIKAKEKAKAKTRCVHDVNAKGLYYKNMTKTK
jgi:hypothetical protein